MAALQPGPRGAAGPTGACCHPPAFAVRAIETPRPGSRLAGRAIPARFVRLPRGRFRMGSDESLLPADGEGPSRMVRAGPFAIDPFAVTNEWFASFVAETGHVTDAERLEWSAVFEGFLSEGHASAARGAAGASWWRRVEGGVLAPPGGTRLVDRWAR